MAWTVLSLRLRDEMVNSVARGVMSSSIDSTSLHSVMEVPDLLSMPTAPVIAPLGTILDDDLLPNRSCSGERGAGGKWVICIGESRERDIATGDGEGDLLVLRVSFPVSVHAISSARHLEKRSDVGITEPRLEVEDMLVKVLEGDTTAEVTDDERERFDETPAKPSTI